MVIIWPFPSPECWRECDVLSDGTGRGSELHVHTPHTPENLHQCLSTDWRHATVKENPSRSEQNK